MTRTGEREICSVSGRLPDNPGELARMQKTSKCGKNISDTLGYCLVCHFFVLTTF